MGSVHFLRATSEFSPAPALSIMKVSLAVMVLLCLTATLAAPVPSRSIEETMNDAMRSMMEATGLMMNAFNAQQQQPNSRMNGGQLRGGRNGAASAASYSSSNGPCAAASSRTASDGSIQYSSYNC